MDKKSNRPVESAADVIRLKRVVLILSVTDLLLVLCLGFLAWKIGVLAGAVEVNQQSIISIAERVNLLYEQAERLIEFLGGG